MLARALILAIAGTTLLGACSRSEPPPPPKAQSAAPKAAAAAGPSAAAQIEKNVLQPPAPKVPEPAPAPPNTDPPKGAARADLPKVPRPAPAPQPAPQPASPQAATSRTDLAAARPAPAPESAAARLLNRVDPDFPREAIQAGVEQGNVRARMTLDAGGNVTRVEIVDATPRRVFDRAVVRALSQWRYSDGPAGRTVDMEVAFKR